ncbi:hypothetical protein AQUCO_11800033v1 [Aquilegia coerulea]|uniref:Uncharacterized protein n=1 Tax=Aquilegia coerulea TaxID=218851 RepID=A0A2G5C255_AQUCA|nr:hypothetical protein AQUCO_11800033v1 [Aquilegia coerulea]
MSISQRLLVLKKNSKASLKRSCYAKPDTNNASKSMSSGHVRGHPPKEAKLHQGNQIFNYVTSTTEPAISIFHTKFFLEEFNFRYQMFKSKAQNFIKNFGLISTQIFKNKDIGINHHNLILGILPVMTTVRTTTISKPLSLMRSIGSSISTSRVCFCTSAVNLSNGDAGISMVQGASRGIGLEFVKQLLGRNEKGHVIATCRNPDRATGLLELKKQFPEHLDIQQLDVTDESTIEASANSIRERYGSLSLLINASGILSIPNVIQPETTLSKVQKSSLLLAYEVNAVGPIMVIKHMWPLLKAGKGFGTGQDFAVVANISARVGSIGDNRLGGWHSYRSSKSALNQCLLNLWATLERSNKEPIGGICKKEGCNHLHTAASRHS